MCVCVCKCVGAEGYNGKEKRWQSVDVRERGGSKGVNSLAAQYNTTLDSPETKELLSLN